MEKPTQEQPLRQKTEVDYDKKGQEIMEFLITTRLDFTQYDFFRLAVVFGIPREQISLLSTCAFRRFEKAGQITKTKKTRLCGKAQKQFEVWEEVRKVGPYEPTL